MPINEKAAITGLQSSMRELVGQLVEGTHAPTRMQLLNCLETMRLANPYVDGGAEVLPGTLQRLSDKIRTEPVPT